MDSWWVGMIVIKDGIETGIALWAWRPWVEVVGSRWCLIRWIAGSIGGLRLANGITNKALIILIRNNLFKHVESRLPHPAANFSPHRRQVQSLLELQRLQIHPCASRLHLPLLLPTPYLTLLSTRWRQLRLWVPVRSPQKDRDLWNG